MTVYCSLSTASNSQLNNYCFQIDLHRCDRSSDCHQQAECRRGMCHCTGLTAGNGLNCTGMLATMEKCRRSEPSPAIQTCGVLTSSVTKIVAMMEYILLIYFRYVNLLFQKYFVAYLKLKS